MLDIIFGGITGLVGTIWSGYNNRKVKELEIKAAQAQHGYNLARIKAESQAMITEAKANIQITQSKVQGMVELAEAQAFGISQQYGNAQSLPATFAEKLANAKGWVRFVTLPLLTIIAFLLGLADVLKGFARPLITIYLLLISSWISYQAWVLLSHSKNIITANQAVSLVELAISTLLYLTTTAVTWWFGDRMNEKTEQQFFKKRGK